MNKEESKRAIKMLEKAISNDYLNKSDVQEFYELFRENRIGIFLETGELYSCNKRNAEKLIKSIKEDVQRDKRKRFRQVAEIITLLLGILTAILELTGISPIEYLQSRLAWLKEAL